MTIIFKGGGEYCVGGFAGGIEPVLPAWKSKFSISGELIGPGPSDDRLRASNPEVNVARPTVHDQVDAALKYYPDPAAVDVILLSACGNDVGVENLLNAAKVEEIDDLAKTKCGAPMERLLRRTAGAFRAATIIVVGHYPFFSEKTRNDSS